MVEKHFDFGWVEIIIASQESFGVAPTVIVTRWRFIGVTKVGVRPSLNVTIVYEVEVVTSSESGTIAIVGVDGIVVVSVNGCFEWLQIVLVTE